MPERDDFPQSPEYLLALSLFSQLKESAANLRDVEVFVVSDRDLEILAADTYHQQIYQEIRRAQALLQLEKVDSKVAILRASWQGPLTVPTQVNLNGLTIIGGRHGELYAGDPQFPVTAGYYVRVKVAPHHFVENVDTDMYLILPI